MVGHHKRSCIGCLTAAVCGLGLLLKIPTGQKTLLAAFGQDAVPYQLDTVYISTDFFSEFDFFTEDDPTGGFVDYVDRATAYQHGLVTNLHGRAQIRADTRHVVQNGQRGRMSVRLQSRRRWSDGLWVMHLRHMPEGCSTWPAFWTNGRNWPEGGEIDILEGANDQPFALSALHTTSGCDMSSVSDTLFSGIWTPKQSRDCYHAATPYNTGCAIQARTTSNASSAAITCPFGANFNHRYSKRGGAYVVMELDRFRHIRMWMFEPKELPDDLPKKLQKGSQSKKCGHYPDPDSWRKKPFAVFPLQSNCPAYLKFGAQQIIINLTFCGGWAGWNYPPHCVALSSAKKNGSAAQGSVMDMCMSRVRNEPAAFQDSYWDIDYLAVFQRTALTPDDSCFVGGRHRHMRENRNGHVKTAAEGNGSSTHHQHDSLRSDTSEQNLDAKGSSQQKRSRHRLNWHWLIQKRKQPRATSNSGLGLHAHNRIGRLDSSLSDSEEEEDDDVWAGLKSFKLGDSRRGDGNKSSKVDLAVPKSSLLSKKTSKDQQQRLGEKVENPAKPQSSKNKKSKSRLFASPSLVSLFLKTGRGKQSSKKMKKTKKTKKYSLFSEKSSTVSEDDDSNFSALRKTPFPSYRRNKNEKSRFFRRKSTRVS